MEGLLTFLFFMLCVGAGAGLGLASQPKWADYYWREIKSLFKK